MAVAIMEVQHTKRQGVVLMKRWMLQVMVLKCTAKKNFKDTTYVSVMPSRKFNNLTGRRILSILLLTVQNACFIQA